MWRLPFLVLSIFGSVAWGCPDFSDLLPPEGPDVGLAIARSRKFQDPQKEKLQRLAAQIHPLFREPGEARRFVERLERFPERVLRDLEVWEKSQHLEPTGKIAALMVARGTIKDLVYRGGRDARQQLQDLNASLDPLFNLFSPMESRSFLEDTLGQPWLNEKGLAQLSLLLERETGHNLEAFRRDPRLHDIFADEVVAILRQTLEDRIVKLPPDHATRPAIRARLDKVTADRVGDLTFSLSGRNVDGLQGGDLAGDCTAVGSINFWTQGAWNATAENNELRVNYQGKFFARLVYTIGTSNGKPTVWVHAAEFTPLARPGSAANASRFTDKELQKRIFKETLQFLAQRAKVAGMEDVLVTGISNSYGFTDLVQPIVNDLAADKTSKVGKLEDHPFRLLNGLGSAHLVLDGAEGPVDRSIPVYYQGWPRGKGFPRAAAPDVAGARPSTVTYGDKTIQRTDLDIASRLIAQVVKDAVYEHYRTIGGFTNQTTFKEVVKIMLASDNPREQAKAYFGRLRETFLSLTRAFDPAEARAIEAKLREMEEDMVEKIAGAAVKIPPEHEEAMKLVRRSLKKELDREPEVEFRDILPRAKRRAYRQIRDGETDVDREEVDFVLDSIPLDEEDPLSARYARDWRRRYREGVLAGFRGFDQWWSRRPPTVRTLGEQLYQRLRVLDVSSAEPLPGPALVDVLDRADPEFRKAIAKALKDAQISPEAKDIIAANPGQAVDYYMDESRQGRREGPTPLSAPVHALSLKPLLDAPAPK